MRNSFRIYLALELILASTTSLLNAGVSTTQATATQIAQKLVPATSSLTISSVTSQGTSAQRGTFTAVAADQIGTINHTDGIILSTGNIASAPSAQSTLANTTTSSGSDAALTALMGGQTSKDSSYVQFTVTNPEYATRTIYIYYTFASEEYPDYIFNLKNDAMGIWVNGVNQATIYGGPVSIANVNQTSNSSNWYNNYDPFGARYRAANFVYGGYTITWYIAIQVPYNTSKTIRIGIADGDDTEYDAAVFAHSTISW